MSENFYDTAIVGGGLAGLCLAIQLAKAGKQVVLFEKKTYPFHKVCGEYISMESWPFLESLGLPLQSMNLPQINKLQVSAPDGFLVNAALVLGGFGISRYKLDAMLKDIAIQHGAKILDHSTVKNIEFQNEKFRLETTAGTFEALSCTGSWGKRSNIDVKWKRPFTQDEGRRLNQYAGIKYHIENDEAAADTIVLHNFENGYCGMSQVEDGKYCLCYLTHIKNLKASDQSIEKMEATMLAANPHLKKILNRSRKIFETPVSISQVSFQQKKQVEHHVLLLGDAAGMISPLCGNGMSMAMHASKIAAIELICFLDGKQTREMTEKNYVGKWRAQFARRLWIGRTIQYFFGKKWTTNFFIRLMKKFPSLTNWLIQQTHGSVF